jgi:ribosomal protein L7/L12
MSDNIQEKAAPAEITTPIIVSLGKKKKKVIKRLKRGKGAAMDEVLDVVEQVQANLGDDAAGKVIVPVVVIYRQKMRRFRGIF